MHKQTLSLKDFVTNASHELKTPLTALAVQAIVERAGARFGGIPRGLSQVLIGGRDIGEALVGVVTGVAPEAVILGGRMTQLGDHLATGVRESITR